MKIQVEHDEQGAVHAVAIAVTRGAHTMSLRARPGYQVSEVHAPHVEHPTDWTNLQRTPTEFRIEGSGAAARLVKKSTTRT